MMTSDPYPTLSDRGEAETRVKASRFLAVAAPAGSEEEARAVLAERQRLFFDATHHCSAWRLHGGVWRANDAGEPSGSAGAPILAAIDGAGLRDCVVVVTRYYGGTKLGVGGLVRAYGDAAALALRGAPRRLATPAVRVRVGYDYSHTAAVMRVMERLEAREVEHGFAAGGAGGEVEFTVASPQHSLLPDLLREQTAGAVSAETIGPRLLYSPL
jgi:uncharacterized YigZ family protein